MFNYTQYEIEPISFCEIVSEQGCHLCLKQILEIPNKKFQKLKTFKFSENRVFECLNSEEHVGFSSDRIKHQQEPLILKVSNFKQFEFGITNRGCEAIGTNK